MTPMQPEPALARHLAETLVRMRQGGDERLLRATVALLCQQRDAGHVCVSLAEWQGRAAEDGGEPFPAVPVWRAALLATGLCNDGAPAAEPSPLVLTGPDRLYLLRHHRTEQRLVAFLRTRLAAPATTTPAALARSLAALKMLPEPPGSAVDWQLAAVCAAAHRSFAVLCGGPGTGKTTTVARLLAVLLHQDPALRIALAAPTGKAAARLGEALRARAAEHPHLAAAAASMPTRTLHRLLEYLPTEDVFRAGPDRPLPYDVVVVDEASMVDPAIMAVLFEALRPTARILLVGDRDQLAAVAAGQVLGDLCSSARPQQGVGNGLAAFVAAATGMQLPVQEPAAPLADATIALRRNHRFGSQPGIGSFAEAVARRAPEAAMAALTAGHADLGLAADKAQALAAIEPSLVGAARAEDPQAALQALGSARILTASRHGTQGAAAWNRAVEDMLRRRGLRIDGPWYDGRPVLVTANDHQNQLWNGDLGVARRGPGGKAFVWFQKADGSLRPIAGSRLPPHETAWAMTVHKAQGSEFDDVLVSMPEGPGPLWHASLVYTGVTRARRRAIVLADPTLLAACLGHWPARASGLVDALAAR